MLRTLILVSFSVLPGLALAQDAPRADPVATARCLLAGKAFSPGATVRAAAEVDLCSEVGTWVATDKAASGCFFGDNFYSSGSTASVSSSKTLVSSCGKDGTWSAGPASD